MQNLRLAGFNIGCYRTRSIMRKLKLVVKQRQAYKVKTKHKRSDSLADNLLCHKFTPEHANLVWAGDVTYLRTNQGWMYLAVVVDLYSRKVIGWSISNRITVDLVARALQMAINIRRPKLGLMFHSDRGSQYTSGRFSRLLTSIK